MNHFNYRRCWRITKRKDLNGSKEPNLLDEIENSSQIEMPKDPLLRVIGQDEAVELARLAAKQGRHLLLVGPPGTGKSMIAQALSLHLLRPQEEIRIVHNPENPERPFVEIKRTADVLRERESRNFAEGELIDPREIPVNVAERLGYRCSHCGEYSSPRDNLCPKCAKSKISSTKSQSTNPFSDILGNLFEITVGGMAGKDKVTTTRKRFGKEEVVVFERVGEMIKILDQAALEKRRELEKISPRKILVPLNRNPFILATGASETELLGDVRHDPYGGHPQLGLAPYERVVAGAIHEAHEGVLFIDEIPLLGQHQRCILTAMQEKRFPISGRNPQSAGASVRVENVSCDFIFVGACNIQDLPQILSPLRSRINGSGYEILLETAMTDNEGNRTKMAQFVSQEISFDGKIPHATTEAIIAITNEAHKRAKQLDGKDNSLTLRLRELGGLIRAAGDIAVLEKDELIDVRHIKQALKRAKTIEEQIKERYGSYYGALEKDISGAQKESSPYYFRNYESTDYESGYR